MAVATGTRAEVPFEDTDAPHRLVHELDPLRHIHLVEEETGVDAVVGVLLETFDQRRFVEIVLDEEPAESGCDDRGFIPANSRITLLHG